MSDIARHTTLYEQAQFVFKREAPWLTMNHSIVFMVTRNRVRNYNVDPFGGQYFYGVDVTDQ